MSKTEIAQLRAHLETLHAFQENLAETGHNFWHCAEQDSAHEMPFYYYQRNKTVTMSTCGTCQQLMANRLKIRAIQRKLNIEQTPLKTNSKGPINEDNRKLQHQILFLKGLNL